jgi:hypothetical protein
MRCIQKGIGATLIKIGKRGSKKCKVRSVKELASTDEKASYKYLLLMACQPVKFKTVPLSNQLRPQN